jgi:hypothetical protein
MRQKEETISENMSGSKIIEFHGVEVGGRGECTEYRKLCFFVVYLTTLSI